jgi:8-oxo-dGTP diphosphatase
VPEIVVDPGAIGEPYLHVVAAIVWHPRESGRFLISRRQKGKHLEDFWELPGGKLESDESRWQGLQRELLEEIDIEATSGHPFMQVYHRYPERNVLLDTWMVEEYRGVIHARENQLVAWVRVDALGDYRFPAADLPVLEAIARKPKAENRHSG